MGKDKSLKPTTLSRADRSKQARETINKTIPRILAGNPRAEAGVAGARLLRYLPSSSVPSAAGQHLPIIRVLAADTLDAARSLWDAHPRDKIAVLSMASPLRPGGGVLTGASAQEESLCHRTTLFPSLRDEWYRIPDDALIYTPNVLVFRARVDEPALLPKSDQFFIDVLSCAALRLPEVSGGKYVKEADREVMANKVKHIMRVAVDKGCKRIVLGALGCGAYANPAEEVAGIFRRVICGKLGKPIRAVWTGIEEIVFAIYDSKGANFAVFQNAFEGVSQA